MITVATIIDAVCLEFQMTPTMLLGRQSAQKFSRPRHIAMVLATELTLHSLPQIGRCFNDRDHTTIANGVARGTALIAKDANIASRVQRIRSKLAEGVQSCS